MLIADISPGKGEYQWQFQVDSLQYMLEFFCRKIERGQIVGGAGSQRAEEVILLFQGIASLFSSIDKGVKKSKGTTMQNLKICVKSNASNTCY